MTHRIVVGIALLGVAACAPKSGDAPATAAPTAMAASTPERDYKPVAAALVHAGMVGDGDRVVISGTGSAENLLDEIALAAMKAGADPLITVSSENLSRRSFDDVPATYDSKLPKLSLAMVGVTDVIISTDFGNNDTLMKGVPAERIAARAKAAEPVNQAYYKRPSRNVNLGNGLYPTSSLASALGTTEAKLADIFWPAVAIPSDSLKVAGTKVFDPLKGAKEIKITTANGTDITFGLDAAKGFISDGVLTPEKVKQGAAAMSTYLPAGEILVPVSAGSGTGKVVIDKVRYNGTVVEGLTLTFEKGKMKSMTATKGIEEFQKRFNAAGGGKDVFSWLDIGVNPAVSGLPTNTGRIVWVEAGGITIGMGDNRGWGGSNASDFTMTGALTSPTLTADGKVVFKDGKVQ